MKRTVKAWAYRWDTGNLCCADVDNYGGSGPGRLRDKHHAGLESGIGKIVPCTITYDDGKKPKAKKGEKR